MWYSFNCHGRHIKYAIYLNKKYSYQIYFFVFDRLVQATYYHKRNILILLPDT